LFRELATELLNDDWGQFDEERLALAAESLERGKALGDAKEVWAQIADRFPGSEAAEEARRLLRARDH
jgi:TolA-binding protein